MLNTWDDPKKHDKLREKQDKESQQEVDKAIEKIKENPNPEPDWRINHD